MDKIKVSCVNCNLPMVLLSVSGVNNKVDDREIWFCNKCNMEVLVVYN